MTQGPTSPPPGSPTSWPAGWYPDPWFPGQQRYWDGGVWTTHVSAPAAPAAVPAPAPAADAYGAPVAHAADAYGAPAGSAADAYVAPVGSAADPYGAPVRGGDPFAPPWATESGRAAGGWLATDPGVVVAGTPSPRRRWLPIVIALVVVAAVAATVTVASGAGERKRSAVGVPTPGLALPTTPSTTIPAPVSSDPNAGVLARLDVGQADAPAGYTVGLIQGGNLVTGQVTLDLCNGTFASEALRTARRQVDLVDRTGQLALSTEAVLYGNSAATAQAFTELRARAAACPQTFVPPPPGEDTLPAARTTFNPVPDTTWAKTASVERLAYDFTSADQQGNTQRSVAVYLRRGRVLVGVYFANPQQPQPSVAGKTTVAGIVGVVEQRIAALPGSVVNATVAVPAPSGSV